MQKKRTWVGYIWCPMANPNGGKKKKKGKKKAKETHSR
jgi:hypothetical protein